MLGLAKSRLGQQVHVIGGRISIAQPTKIACLQTEALAKSLVPWLWNRRDLLPMHYVPLLCFKCATWMLLNGLHRTETGVELLRCLTHGNRNFSYLVHPAEYVAWLESLSAAQDGLTRTGIE